MMKHKAFKIIAIICGIILLFCFMALDSDTLIPVYVSLPCLIYICIYAAFRGCEIDVDKD